MQDAFQTIEISDTEDNLDELDESDQSDHEDQTTLTSGRSRTDCTANAPKSSNNSDMGTTTVQFTHARIRDFLLQCGMVDGVGIHPQKAHSHITEVCLLLLTNEIPKVDGRPWEAPNLLDYAADYFVEHLIEVDRWLLGDADRVEISRLLHLHLFPTVNIELWFVHSRANLLKDILLRRDVFELVCAWILDPAYLHTLEGRQRRALEASSGTPTALFRPIARILDSVRLVLNWPIPEPLEFLYAYSKLLEAEANDLTVID